LQIHLKEIKLEEALAWGFSEVAGSGKKLTTSLFPGPNVALKPNAFWKPWRKRRLFPSLPASLHPIAPRVRNRLEAGNKRQG